MHSEFTEWVIAWATWIAVILTIALGVTVVVMYGC